MPQLQDVHSLDGPVALSDVTVAHPSTCPPRVRTASITSATGSTKRLGSSSVSSTPHPLSLRETFTARRAVRSAKRSPRSPKGGIDMTIDHETSSAPTPQAEHGDHAPAEAWDAIAAGYAEHVAPSEQRISDLALDLVGLRADESFLDVAAGPGGLGLAAARRGATVLATDWAPSMLAQFESKVRSEGLANAAARVMDAHALELDSDTST